MTGLMQALLGADWARLPPALQAHHRGGRLVEHGHLDIRYPRPLQPLFALLHRLAGVLVDRQGLGVATTVCRQAIAGGQRWQRTLAYADGRCLHFDSVWVAAGRGHLIEWVNPWLGLEMRPSVAGEQLRFDGVCYRLRLGRWCLPIPQSLALGRAVIVEQADGERHVRMDFRLVHPLFGELFRYAGRFEVDPAP